MDSLKIEVLPFRPAVRSDVPVTLDVLLRILPPEVTAAPERPALNVGLVLDRSGSMEGARKIDYARQAAAFAVEQLLPEDRVSVTIFDNEVELLVPSTKASQRQHIIDLIRGVQPRGSTALHAGWTQGANQVREFLLQGGLNRVLLLTDGLANVGETNTDNICTHVKGFAVQGVSTTTMGVGNDYNEDLLEAMAKSGDGNYYYIESPVQLADMFATELRGLMATTGRRVLLGLEPRPGVEVVDVLNDLDRDPQGRLVLPNLIVGLPVEVVLRLRVQPQVTASVADLCAFHVSWIDPRGGEQSQEASLALPGVTESGWNGLESNALVRERAALQEAGRLKRQATFDMDQGLSDQALEKLSRSRQSLEGLDPSQEVELEKQDIDSVEKRVREGDLRAAAKLGKAQRYMQEHSKPRKE
jgi:Ca-activated chloride channel family protein